MSKNDVIWIEGEKALFLNMQRRMDVSISSARKALRTAGMNIVNDAKTNLRNNGSIGQSNLRNSGRVQAVEGDPDAIDAGFPMPYAFYVENGTKGGGKRTIKSMMPRIIQWLRKKGKFGEDGMSIAYFISRKIVKKGTQPHPFFGPAVEKNKKAVTDAISEAVKKETERNG